MTIAAFFFFRKTNLVPLAFNHFMSRLALVYLTLNLSLSCLPFTIAVSFVAALFFLSILVTKKFSRISIDSLRKQTLVLPNRNGFF